MVGIFCLVLKTIDKNFRFPYKLKNYLHQFLLQDNLCLSEHVSSCLDNVRLLDVITSLVVCLLQKLATSCDVLSEKCVKVVNEQELQLKGWNAAVANSNTVLQ